VNSLEYGKFIDDFLIDDEEEETSTEEETRRKTRFPSFDDDDEDEDDNVRKKTESSSLEKKTKDQYEFNCEDYRGSNQPLNDIIREMIDNRGESVEDIEWEDAPNPYMLNNLKNYLNNGRPLSFRNFVSWCDVLGIEASIVLKNK